MSHNTPIRPALPSGANPWTFGQPVVEAEWQAFDDAQFKSLNGDAGGTWAPGSQIVFGGAGVKFMGVADINSCAAMTIPLGLILACAIGSVVQFGHTLTFANGSRLEVAGAFDVNASGTVDVDGGCTVNVAPESLWTLNGNITGTLASQGITSVTGASNVSFASGSFLNFNSGNLLFTDAHAAWHFTGATTYSSTCTLTQACPEIPTGAAATMQWRFAAAPDANTSFDCSEDTYFRAAAITGNRIYTLLDATATIPPANGMVLKFSLGATGAGHTLTFKREDGSTVAFVGDLTLYGALVSFIYRDGAWHTFTWHDQ